MGPAEAAVSLIRLSDSRSRCEVPSELGGRARCARGRARGHPLGIHFGPLNGRVLVGGFAGGVLEFDAGTDAYIRMYVPPLWAWSAVHAPNGNVLVASSATVQILEYDSVTGAFVQLWAPLPGAPSDMAYGPNGNLYVCTFVGGMVWELDPVTGNPISH